MNGTKNAHITKQPIIQPQKKDIIQLIETENAKSKAEATEFLEKFKAVTAHKNNIEDDQITMKANLIENMEATIVEEENDNRDCINEEELDEKKNIPPKPLPRKSISEQSSTEEFPKPRPRVTAGNNYKVSTFLIRVVFGLSVAVVDFTFLILSCFESFFVDAYTCVELFLFSFLLLHRFI